MNRKLEIDDEEAAIVRYLFNRYLELRSVRALMADVNEQAFRIRPPRSSDRAVAADVSSPRRFGRGQLYHVLSNPVYVGKVRHRAKVYDGAHAPIIDADTFAAAQVLLAEQAPARAASTNGTDLHLLTGLLFDGDGNRLRALHTRKGNVRYRYYASDPHRGGGDAAPSRGWRLRARIVEEVIERELVRLCDDGPRLSSLLQPVITGSEMGAALANAASLKSGFASSSHQQRRDLLRTLLRRIELGDAVLRIHLDRARLAAVLTERRVSDIDLDDQERQVTIESHFTLRRRGIETKLVLADSSVKNASPDDGLKALLAKAHHYLRQLTDGSGRGVSEVAAANKVDRSDFTRILRMAFLAPDMVDRILNGSQPVELSAQSLSRLAELPHSWANQRALLGI